VKDVISKAMLDHTAFKKSKTGYKKQEVLTCQGMLFAVVLTEQQDGGKDMTKPSMRLLCPVAKKWKDTGGRKT